MLCPQTKRKNWIDSDTGTKASEIFISNTMIGNKDNLNLKKTFQSVGGMKKTEESENKGTQRGVSIKTGR